MAAAREVRIADLLLALALATDLGNRFPPDKTLRTCLLAAGLGRVLGLDRDTLADVYYLVLLRFIGCTSFAHEEAALFGGDDIAFRRTFTTVDLGNMREMLGALPQVASHAPPHRRVLAVLNLMRGADGFDQAMLAAYCDIGQQLATRLGMSPRVVRALTEVLERWDGQGPAGTKGAGLELIGRVVQLANVAELLEPARGREGVVAMVRQRAGGQFDPDLCAAFVEHAEELLAPLREPELPAAALAAEPAPWRYIQEGSLDELLTVFADLTDLKSPWLTGHSRRVAELARDAARQCRLDEGEVRLAWRAAVVHDLGRITVPSGIWDKPGRLTPAEWEVVRLHPYHSERCLQQSSALAPLAALAGMHHERCDGSGYYRGVSGAAIPLAGRILGAADSYDAMVSDRPYRSALSPDEAAARLRDGGRGGLLAPEAVEAVLAAAGHRARRPRPVWPAGLTDREIEVLRLLVRGRKNREIAADLVISDKTVHHHVLHIYDKIGVSSRAGAAVFAMTHDLIPAGYGVEE